MILDTLRPLFPSLTESRWGKFVNIIHTISRRVASPYCILVSDAMAINLVDVGSRGLLGCDANDAKETRGNRKSSSTQSSHELSDVDDLHMLLHRVRSGRFNVCRCLRQ